MKETSVAKVSCWAGLTCTACHFSCRTVAEKNIHEKENEHAKKLGVYSFIVNECSKTTCDPASSTLLHELGRRQKTVIGLECFIEIKQPISSVHLWWVCSLCNKAGNTYDSAVRHSLTVPHLNFYIKTFYPHRRQKIPTGTFVDSCNFSNHVVSMAQTIFFETGAQNKPPQIIETSLGDTDLLVQLNTPVREELYHLILIENGSKDKTRYMMLCNICHDYFPCTDDTRSRIWKKHIATAFHVNATHVKRVIKNGLAKVNCVVDEPKNRTVSAWRCENGNYFGPLCGLNFLIMSASGSNGYCSLCFKMVKSIQEHFTSEHHISRFVALKNTLLTFSLREKTGVVRREGYITILECFSLNNNGYMKLLAPKIPTCFTNSFNITKLLELAPVPEKLFGDTKCVTCKTCCIVIPIENGTVDDIWNGHFDTPYHFDMFAHKLTFAYDEVHFIPFVSQFELPHTEILNGWCTRKVGGVNTRVLSFGDVGLEYLVDDLDAREIVCTLCGEWFSKDARIRCQNHIRSYGHIHKYLTYTNRALFYYMSLQTTQLERECVLYDHLKRNLCLETTDTSYQINNRRNKSTIRVYSTTCSKIFNEKVNVPVNHPSTEEQMKLGSLIQTTCCRLREFCNSTITGDSKIIVHCLDCNVSFTCLVRFLTNALFRVHFNTHEHIRRSQDLRALNLRLFGFVTRKAVHYVDRGMQSTWITNVETGAVEYTKKPVGVCHITERRSVIDSDLHIPDFYCRICLMRIAYNPTLLEEHIRSITHIVLYMKLINPVHFFQILNRCKSTCALQTEIANWCRTRHEGFNDNSILVFDPAHERNCLGYTVARFCELESLNAHAERNKALKMVEEIMEDITDTKPKVTSTSLSHNSDTNTMSNASNLNSIIPSDALGNKSKLLLPELAASLSSFTRSILNSKSAEKSEQSCNVEEMPTTSSGLLDNYYYSDDSMSSKDAANATNRSLPVEMTLDTSQLLRNFVNGSLPVKKSVNEVQSVSILSPITSIVGEYAIPICEISTASDMSIAGEDSSDTCATTAIDIVALSGQDSLADCNSVSNSFTFIGELNTMESAVKTFLLFQQEKIPEAETPTAINEEIVQNPNTLGVESVFQVLCSDDPFYLTFFCSLCKLWILEKNLITHICDFSHKSNYMKVHHRPFYDSLVMETDLLVASSMLNEYAKLLEQNSEEKGVQFRLKCRVPRVCGETVLQSAAEEQDSLTVHHSPPSVRSLKLYKVHKIPIKKRVFKKRKPRGSKRSQQN